MNKRELATVLVRFAGLYFAYLAVKKIAAVAYAALLVCYVLDDMNKGLEFSEKVSLSSTLPGVISFFITAGVACYFLKRGTWVIDFLSKDLPNKTNEA